MLISGLAYVGKQGEGYSLRNHFVSERGELGVSQLAVMFNWSLITGGLVSTVFVIYISCQIDHWI